jgi:hypothetical protein
MWSLETWTEGERFFFEELRSVLEWLKRDHEDFIRQLVLDGGTVILIAQLPGQLNIGDELDPKIMALAADLGVRLGVEVFPNLQRSQ